MTLLVTGGSSGIGRAVVLQSLAVGRRVLAHGRDRAALQELAAAGAHTIVGDLLDPGCVGRIAEVADGLEVDAVVASQGVAGDGALDSLTPERIRQVMDVNAASVVRLFDALRAGLRTRGGTYVVVASQASLRPEMYDSVYCASKWAALHWVQAIAPQEATAGVHVRAICPGRTVTALFDRAMSGFAAAAGQTLEHYTQATLDLIPLRRFASVEETAAATLFLAAHAPRPTVLAETGGEVPSWTSP